MVPGYALTAFPNAFVLQQLQLKQQPTKQAWSKPKRRGIGTVHNWWRRSGQQVSIQP